MVILSDERKVSISEQCYWFFQREIQEKNHCMKSKLYLKGEGVFTQS